ncbi:MAG TPA: hypothetical protein VGK35_09705 [Actinotalea sp.]|jgi:hypothetical protein
MVAVAALVMAAAVTAVGVALCLAALVRRDGTRARHWALLAVIVPSVYLGVLAAVGLTSRPHERALGEWRCFDDWCVTVSAVDRVDATTRLVHLQIRSDARRVHQRPDQPRVSVRSAAGNVPVSVQGLDQRLGPGQRVSLEVTVTVTGADPRLVVEEGSVPLVIGDEDSWWHARSGWPL